jgi:hypothetical protein
MLTVPFASAYTGLFYPGTFSLDTNSIVLIGIFLLTYLGGMFTMKNQNMTSKFSFSIIIALATAWGVSKANINFASFFTTYNLQGIMGVLGPIIIISMLIVAMWKWGVSAILLVAAGISFFIATLTTTILTQLNATFFVIFGTFLLLIVLIIKKGKLPKIRIRIKKTKEEIKETDQAITAEQNKPAEYRDRHNLARLLGIKNLENQLLQLETQYKKLNEEFEEGQEKAKKLHQGAKKGSKGKWAGTDEEK